MPIPALVAFSLKLALDWLGPSVIGAVKRSIEEADGKFKSDWRRSIYVHRAFKRALASEGKLIRTKRGFRRTMVELLVQEWKSGRGIPGFDFLPAPPTDPTDRAGA